eukprot:3762139-Pyramimonas_sp.AAC.1
MSAAAIHRLAPSGSTAAASAAHAARRTSAGMPNKKLAGRASTTNRWRPLFMGTLKRPTLSTTP